MLEAALVAGQPVAIFPEGTRTSGPEIAELFDGAAYLSVKLGVPIVPVGIGGSEHILPEGQGVPAHPSGRGRGARAAAAAGAGRAGRGVPRLGRLTEELRASLQACFDDANRLAPS